MVFSNENVFPFDFENLKSTENFSHFLKIFLLYYPNMLCLYL